MKTKKNYLVLLILIIFVTVIACAYLFNPLQSEPACSSYTYDKCPKSCVVCPSCETCSSVRCQTAESCEKLGFNRSWSEDINKRLQEP